MLFECMQKWRVQQLFRIDKIFDKQKKYIKKEEIISKILITNYFVKNGLFNTMELILHICINGKDWGKSNM